MSEIDDSSSKSTTEDGYPDRGAAIDEDKPAVTEDRPSRRWFRHPPSVRGQVVGAGLAIVLALSGTVGWLGYRAHQSHQITTQTLNFVEVGRQGAINLTTINWEHAEADVERILASASGTFYDDFEQRSTPFIEVVKQTKSTSIGTVTQAGLESAAGDEARVLVAVSVKTTLQGQPEVAPRAWRMRMTVQRQGGDMTVSNVEFVP